MHVQVSTFQSCRCLLHRFNQILDSKIRLPLSSGRLRFHRLSRDHPSHTQITGLPPPTSPRAIRPSLSIRAHNTNKACSSFKAHADSLPNHITIPDVRDKASHKRTAKTLRA